jgi:plasmid stabilization system protein ParE
MNYTVIWTTRAEQHLATAWLAASNRNAVTTAAHALEQDLRRDPIRLGESRRSGVDRVELRPPLGISFTVVVDDLTVYVTAVWLIN